MSGRARKLPPENDEFASFADRVLAVMARRAASGDPEDLARLREVIDKAEASLGLAVAGLRSQGHSWAQIGQALGMTRQSAWERFSKDPSGQPDTAPREERRSWA